MMDERDIAWCIVICVLALVGTIFLFSLIVTSIENSGAKQMCLFLGYEGRVTIDGQDVCYRYVDQKLQAVLLEDLRLTGD
jgi:hypothetical protein